MLLLLLLVVVVVLLLVVVLLRCERWEVETTATTASHVASSKE